MVQPTPSRLPSHLLPRQKAIASTSLDASQHGDSSHPSRESSRHRANSRPFTDVSPRATEVLVRRVLCPSDHGRAGESRPLNELLPPLTSSNDVDLQLYAILAIVMKEFVYTWYGKITQDQTFVEEVIRIVAHCTRDLEQRIRRVDVGSLALDEIPALLSRHVSAYRTAQDPLHPPPIASDPKVVYHTLMPHPAFSPVPDYNKPSTIQEQGSNEAAYRQLLVQGMLAVLLPTEDLRNPCLRSLVGDILGEMILGNGIGGKACEGWMIWDGITKMVENAKVKTDTKATKEEIKVETRSRLEKFGLLSEKERARKNKIDEGIRGRAKSGHGSMIKQSIWRTLQFCYVTFTTIRFIVVGLMAASSSSSSRGQPPLQLKSVRGDVQAPMKEGFEAPGTGAWTVTGGAAAGKRPILSYGCFGLVSQLLDLPSRMPWFSGTLSLIQHQLVEGVAGAGIGAADGILDRFLNNLITTHLLRPELLPPLLLTLRTSLFPNNGPPGPARPIPDAAERLEIKRKAAVAILTALPFPKKWGAGERFLLGSTWKRERDYVGTLHDGGGDNVGDIGKDAQGFDEDAIQEVERILDLFEDQYMNKHLIFGIVEAIVVKILPELATKGPAELMAERLG